MSFIVVDSSVLIKWVLNEPDSKKARHIIGEARKQTRGLVVLDLALVEATNVIWQKVRTAHLTEAEAPVALGRLFRCPVKVEPSRPLLARALAIGVEFDRAIYDALFVALAESLSADAVTADVPLVRAVGVKFPKIKLLSNW